MEKAKAKKKQQREADKKRRDEEKLKEQENKRERKLARTQKRAFDQSWSPTAVAAYGQCLHDRIRFGEPLPPNSFRPPLLGFPPEICRENQRLAIKRRRAKCRNKDVSHLPPLTSPHWAHKPGAPLWSRIQSQEAHNPRLLTSPQGAKQFFMRPYEDGSQSSEPAMHLLVRPAPHRLPLNSSVSEPTSPIAGAFRPEHRTLCVDHSLLSPRPPTC